MGKKLMKPSRQTAAVWRVMPHRLIAPCENVVRTQASGRSTFLAPMASISLYLTAPHGILVGFRGPCRTLASLMGDRGLRRLALGPLLKLLLADFDDHENLYFKSRPSA